MSEIKEGTAVDGWSPTSVKGYRYYLPCRYVARYNRNGVLTWRCEGRASRGYGRGAYFGRREGAWTGEASRSGALFGVHGKAAIATK